MKINVDPVALRDAVAYACRTLPQKSTVPAHSGLLVEAGDDGRLTISAFDYDVTARAGLSGDVAEPGQVLIPGKVLAEVVKKLPDRSMAELSGTRTDVTLTCGTAEFGLPAMPVEDFPTIPDAPAAVGTVDGEAIRRAVGHVAPAASGDDKLVMLVGVRLDVTGGRLSLAATDTTVMTMRDLDWEAPQSASAGMLVHAATLHGIAKTLSGPVQLGWDDGRLAITADGRQSVLRLLDSDFPDYRTYMAKVPQEITAEMEVGALIEAIERVAVIDRASSIRMRFVAGTLEVRAGGGDTGKGRDVLPATLDGADEFEVAFLAKPIETALAGVTTGAVRMAMSLPLKPVLITGVGEDCYQAAVMPVRAT